MGDLSPHRVIYNGDSLLPGAREGLYLREREGKEYLFLTNNSQRTREELQQKLHRLGADVDAMCFYTASLATASFLASQEPGGSWRKASSRTCTPL